MIWYITDIKLLPYRDNIVINQINSIYRQTSNINHTFVGNKIVDYWYVVGASPIGAAPTTPSFST